MRWIKTIVSGRQRQTGGEQSQQYQATGDINISMGVTAAEVVEITQREVSRAVRDQLTPLAEAVATERVERLENKILERFDHEPELRSAFADPDFQFSLRDAGRAAASNDDEHTEDLLVDLLANRAEQGNHTRVRLATSHAIRAADKLSLDALKALTTCWIMTTLGPSTPGALETLVNFEGLAHRLIAIGLPSDPSWTEDAEALDLVRLSPALSRRPFRDFLVQRAAPFLNTGIDAEAARETIEAAASKCPQLSAQFRPHPLKPGFLTLPGANGAEFLATMPAECHSAELDMLISQNGFGIQDQTALAEFSRRIDTSEAMSIVVVWWDGLPVADLTLTGKVVAFVNARRHFDWTGARTLADLLAPPTAA